MRTITAPLRDAQFYQKAVAMLAGEASADIRPGGKGVPAADGIPAACDFDGCVDSQKLQLSFALTEAGELAGRSVVRLFVTYSDIRAKELYEDSRYYDRNTVFFPAKDLIFYQADLRSREITTQRIRCLRRLLEGRTVTVVTTFAALMTPQAPLAVMKDHVLSLSRRETISEDSIAERLVEMGYERNYQVDSPGQFAIRGDIVDIYDLTEENPCRIEFWGDEIESIRSFDILSQRSIEQLETTRIYPATEFILSGARIADGVRRIREELEQRYTALRREMKTEESARLKSAVEEAVDEANLRDLQSGLESYIRYFYPASDGLLSFFDRKRTMLFVDEPARTRESALAVEAEFRESMVSRAEKGYILPGQMDLLIPTEEVEASMARFLRVGLSTLGMPSMLFPEEHRLHLRARSTAPYNNSFDTLLSDLKKLKKNESRVLILSASRTRAKRLAEDITGEGVTAFYSDNPERELKPGEIMAGYGQLLHGFEYTDLKFTVIAETDIFGAEKKRKPKAHRYEGGERIRSFSDLKVGDYVVHEDYGIGIYRGIEKIEVDHIAKDYLKIEYGQGGILYVLPTELSVLQKYSMGEEAKPKLNRLGTSEWQNTRSKVARAVETVADDLVELYAKRQSMQGHAFGQDTVWQREFEEMFPYQETEDQLTAIEDTKKDMESPKIMDRLICGDVGYGKTEVALRAAFKAVQDGFQVAVLVPTTILAQQHYNTFTERLRGYPVNVEVLSRFRTAAEVKKAVAGLASGMTDIVIGTHRLLSKDVKFKNLGLLVVDEEQRFGVTHKEKIKKLRENVDVLTLTATPIPRTLHMSLVGIRDMSILEEAPEERRPIQTYVMEQNDELVREAVVREVARHGQVYYVHNRVNDIAEVAGKLQEMIPEARISYAHGQMDERELERVMYAFINREIDVLVSTTIIETGLDISNVNTMIIQDADRLGLAQLYQLRGRVGRSDRTAYAFLLYRKDRMLREVAEKRLSAIREFTDLGSGYRIAMRDLEIRGAGSVLGRAQHGHMASVGYDLYCKLLGEAVSRAKGEEVEEEHGARVNLSVDAFLPESYIVNEAQKLEIYKKISAINSTDAAEEMKDELTDRFGEIPPPAKNLLRIALIRSVAGSLEISEITGYAGFIRIIPEKNASVRVENIPQLLRKYKDKLRFAARGTPQFEYSYKPTGSLEKDEDDLLNSAEDLLVAYAELLR